jgi:uncharacterized protein (DUF4415 family)
MAERREYQPTPADAPEIEIDEAFWRKARVVMPGEQPKTPVTIRLDQDVLAWFKAQGRGYQTRINAVLRSFVEAQRHSRE